MKIFFALLLSFLMVGCKSVSMQSSSQADTLKAVGVPSEGKSGLYIYRKGVFGAAVRRDLYVNGHCLGETSSNVFFYKEVDGGEDHIISTESELTPNELVISVEKGKNYFIRQYIKIGVFVGGAGLEVVDESRGVSDIQGLGLGVTGTCNMGKRNDAVF